MKPPYLVKQAASTSLSEASKAYFYHTETPIIERQCAHFLKHNIKHDMSKPGVIAGFAISFASIIGAPVALGFLLNTYFNYRQDLKALQQNARNVQFTLNQGVQGHLPANFPDEVATAAVAIRELDNITWQPVRNWAGYLTQDRLAFKPMCKTSEIMVRAIDLPVAGTNVPPQINRLEERVMRNYNNTTVRLNEHDRALSENDQIIRSIIANQQDFLENHRTLTQVLAHNAGMRNPAGPPIFVRMPEPTLAPAPTPQLSQATDAPPPYDDVNADRYSQGASVHF